AAAPHGLAGRRLPQLVPGPRHRPQHAAVAGIDDLLLATHAAPHPRGLHRPDLEEEPMPRTQVSTVSGPVPVAALGRTLVHEHLAWVPDGAGAEWPHLIDRDDESSRAVAALESVKAHGVQTWCDPSCHNLGRDARLAQAAAAATGVNVVLATGAYVY